MDDDQQFCLRWNNHQSTLVSVFDTLLEKGMHVDCTLAAEGQTLKAHKVVLSACSPYFESVLSQQYDKHPIIILKDVKYAELRAMMDYMYRGEVNISQDQLAALLKAAESLQIKGLSDNKPSRPPSRPAPAAAPPALAPPAQRIPSPSPQGCDESVDERSCSGSPARQRKKPRLSSATLEEEDFIKEEPPKEGVEDLTAEEEQPDQQQHQAAHMQHNDVVRNFQWHMERSQDELMNSNDSARDSQEAIKDGRLPSALLTLLSAQRARSLVPPCIQLTNIINPIPKDMPYTHIPKIPLDIATMPENLKAHFLQQAFIQNNRDFKKQDDNDSEAEYDDTDDIVLPEESESVYDSGSFAAANSANSSNDSFENAESSVSFPKRDGNSSDDASRQFECRHCGKKYRWKSTLRRHENVECGGKAPSHQCPYCSYKAKQRGNLGVHIRKHHNNEWYVYASNKIRRNKKTPV